MSVRTGAIVALSLATMLGACGMAEEPIRSIEIAYRGERCFMATTVRNYLFDHAGKYDLYLFCNSQTDHQSHGAIPILSAPWDAFSVSSTQSNGVDKVVVEYCIRYFRELDTNGLSNRIKASLSCFEGPPPIEVVLVPTASCKELVF
jgi:hypothetical protein